MFSVLLRSSSWSCCNGLIYALHHSPIAEGQAKGGEKDRIRMNPKSTSCKITWLVEKYWWERENGTSTMACILIHWNFVLRRSLYLSVWNSEFHKPKGKEKAKEYQSSWVIGKTTTMTPPTITPSSPTTPPPPMPVWYAFKVPTRVWKLPICKQHDFIIMNYSRRTLFAFFFLLSLASAAI